MNEQIGFVLYVIAMLILLAILVGARLYWNRRVIMIEFAQTGYGRKFFDSDLPRLVRALETIAEKLDTPRDLGPALEQIREVFVDDNGHWRAKPAITVVQEVSLILTEHGIGGDQ